MSDRSPAYDYDTPVGVQMTADLVKSQQRKTIRRNHRTIEFERIEWEDGAVEVTAWRHAMDGAILLHRWANFEYPGA